MSDTGSDIAELLKLKNKVDISSKNGVWFQSRNTGAYEPADMFYSRSIDIVNFWGKYGHGIKEWKPSSDYLNSYYIKSRDLISSITKGQITPKGPIVNINIVFQNGEEQYEIILFCTGIKLLNV